MSNLHLSRHETLNKCVRELISDYMTSTDHIPMTVTELLDWSEKYIKKQRRDAFNSEIESADVQRELKKETVV